VGIGDRAEEGDEGGRARLGVSGELDHRGFMLDGARGSMVTMRTSDVGAVYVSAEEDEKMLWSWSVAKQPSQLRTRLV
jgi:hypothetical protein